MKQISKCALVLISVVLSASFACKCSAFENEPDNFRGIKWGTTLADLPDMVVQRTSGEEKICQRKNDKMQIGDATLNTLEYAFYKERFYGVFIEYQGYDKYLSLTDTLFYAYGKQDGVGIDGFASYYWDGINVKVWFRYDIYVNGPDRGVITYLYKPIYEEKIEVKKTSGVGDL